VTEGKPALNTDRDLLLLRAFPAGFHFKDLRNIPPAGIEWERITGTDDPLVFRLKAEDLNDILQRLVEAGLGPATPCAAVSEPLAGPSGATFGTLGDIATRARCALTSAGSMLLLIAEDLSGLRRLLTPQEQALAGKTVLVTRSRKQAGELSRLLEQHGARVLEVPTIEINLIPEGVARLEEALTAIADYGWMILTSANTVSILDQVLKGSYNNWGIFSRLKIACIGSSTARAARECGAEVALIPPDFQAESLLAALLEEGVGRRRILLPRAQGSREVLPAALKENGAEVDEIHIYRSDVPESSRERIRHILAHEPLDFITFTSSSTVHNFVELAGPLTKKIDRVRTRIACIGPITAATLKEYGIPPAIQATEFTIPGLVRAILESTAKEGPRKAPGEEA
jgi:uroporphyrinogen III methyltransferase/synthase